MPRKDWTIHLDETTRIVIFLNSKGPRVLGFAVVLVATVENQEVCITRYDTAHGQAHRDVIGRKAGLLEKQWLLDLTYNQALDYALTDLRNNYAHYIAFYCQN